MPDYVHRVGRTARAGKTGTAIIFLSADELDYVKALHTKKIRLAWNEQLLCVNKLYHSISDSSSHSISPMDHNQYLKGILSLKFLSSGTLQERIAKMQKVFEQFIKNDRVIFEKGCKGKNIQILNCRSEIYNIRDRESIVVKYISKWITNVMDQLIAYRLRIWDDINIHYCLHCCVANNAWIGIPYHHRTYQNFTNSLTKKYLCRQYVDRRDCG